MSDEGRDIGEAVDSLTDLIQDAERFLDSVKDERDGVSGEGEENNPFVSQKESVETTTEKIEESDVEVKEELSESALSEYYYFVTVEDVNCSCGFSFDQKGDGGLVIECGGVEYIDPGAPMISPDPESFSYRNGVLDIKFKRVD